MTEYEYLDVMNSMRDSGGFHAMNYIAILFAYLIAGYFAGHLLSRFQVIALSAFYLILCPMPGIAAFEVILDYGALVTEYYNQFKPGDRLPLFARYGANLWLFVFLGTLALSIYFMFQARRSKRGRENAT